MRRALPALLLLVVAASPTPAQQTHLGKSLDKWVTDLSDRDPAFRRGAAYALGKFDSVRAIQPLAQRLKDPDAAVREAAAWALGDHAERNAGFVEEDAGADLRGLLDDREPRVRRAAAYALGRCGKYGLAAAPDLRKLLADDSPMVRQHAAKALGSVRDAKPDGDSIKALAAACKRGDEDPYVLRELVYALAAQVAEGAEDSPDAVQDAAAGLFYVVKRDPDRLVLKPAMQALQKTATRKQGEQGLAVERYLDDKDAEVRKAAAFTLANTAGPKGGKALKTLRDLLLQDSPREFRVAMSAAGAAGDHLRRQILAREQGAAAAALANLGESAAPAVADLARALDDDSQPLELRLIAVFAISRIAIPLGRQQDNKDPRLAEVAAAAVRKEIEPCVPTLVKALGVRQDPNIRELAAEAMGAFNFSHKPSANTDLACDALVKLLRDDTSARVRQRALSALYTVPDLKGKGALEPMVAIVKDKQADRILRYDTARVLGLKLEGSTPSEAIDALVDMLADTSITVYVPSETKSSGGGGAESTQGGSSKVIQNKGGDARFMAAQGLAAIGPRVKKQRPEAVELLKKLKDSKDPRCVEAAEAALRSIGG